MARLIIPGSAAVQESLIGILESPRGSCIDVSGGRGPRHIAVMARRDEVKPTVGEDDLTGDEQAILETLTTSRTVQPLGKLEDTQIVVQVDPDYDPKAIPKGHYDPKQTEYSGQK